MTGYGYDTCMASNVFDLVLSLSCTHFHHTGLFSFFSENSALLVQGLLM